MNEEKVTGGITTGAGLARPFYDPALSYQENYDLGPFGPFEIWVYDPAGASRR